MIPYRLNPLGISGGQVNWRNFYDNPIQWTGFNALDFSLYASVRIEIDFTLPATVRGSGNQPLFGAYAGNTCPLFVAPYQNSILLLYTYQSGGRYVFNQVPSFPFGQSHTLAYTMTPGSVGSCLVDNIEQFAGGIFSGYPGMGNNISSADCTIQRLQVFGDNVLIWQATKAELTV